MSARCFVLAGLSALGIAYLPAHAQQPIANQGAQAVQALQIVDCLLPGQVRRLGGRSYLTPRRPTRTTAADCAARGGEYLEHDPADYRSALNVWLPAAESGAADAQTIVGEIYEHGLASGPDYEAAVRWYRRAAEQGYTRAQFNLGTLYEQGLGVTTDRLEALNWYRRASGLAEDSLIYQSAAAADLASQRAELAEQIAQRDRQIATLQREIESLTEQLRNRADDLSDVRDDIASLRDLLEQVEMQRQAASEALAAMPTTPPRGAPARTAAFTEPEQAAYRRGDFGRFYALVIGVQDYELLDDLASPANDAARVAQLLRDHYGFSVLTLADPDQLGLMRAINELNSTVGEDDNLLIYFSGHGNRLRSGVRETGYWLPVDANPSPNDTLWVPNDFVSRHLGRLEAKRVLVIADSCYSGLLGDDPGYVMVGNGSYSDEYIEWKKPKRSRLVLSSGSDSPIVEETSDEHSVFARALVEVLETNEQVLTAPELFLRVRERLRGAAAAFGDVQEPELKALKDAGHEVGDFFFIAATG